MRFHGVYVPELILCGAGGPPNTNLYCTWPSGTMWSKSMATTRIEVYTQTDLARQIETAADNRDLTPSKWLKEAARQKLQREQPLEEATDE